MLLYNYFKRYIHWIGYIIQMQACPNCRKPLPRCSLCLVHMGTPAGWDSTTQKTSGQDEGGEGQASASRRKLSHFSSWFTWCQTCRHGGHAHHLMEWFKWVQCNLFTKELSWLSILIIIYVVVVVQVCKAFTYDRAVTVLFKQEDIVCGMWKSYPYSLFRVCEL